MYTQFATRLAVANKDVWKEYDDKILVELVRALEYMFGSVPEKHFFMRDHGYMTIEVSRGESPASSSPLNHVTDSGRFVNFPRSGFQEPLPTYWNQNRLMVCGFPMFSVCLERTLVGETLKYRVLSERFYD